MGPSSMPWAQDGAEPGERGSAVAWGLGGARGLKETPKGHPGGFWGAVEVGLRRALEKVPGQGLREELRVVGRTGPQAGLFLRASALALFGD